MRGAVGLLLLAAVLAGCGQRERTPPLSPVRLQLTAPDDLAEVDARTITVSGTVAPAESRVLVNGVEASVRGGAFTSSVSLEGGANVIDVQASAPRHPAAFAAVRVTRIVPVPVPDVDGLTVDDATERLEALGLEVEVRKINPIDVLLPGTVGVCGTDPGTDAKVRAGTTVTLLVQKSC